MKILFELDAEEVNKVSGGESDLCYCQYTVCEMKRTVLFNLRECTKRNYGWTNSTVDSDSACGGEVNCEDKRCSYFSPNEKTAIVAGVAALTMVAVPAFMCFIKPYIHTFKNY